MNKTRITSRVLLVLAALLVVTLGASFFRPTGFAAFHVGARVTRGQLELAWSNADLGYAPAGWRLSSPGNANARMLVGPPKWWRPVATKAGMTIGNGTAPPMAFTLRALFVPLWWLAIFCGGASYLCHRLARSPEAGHCKACGYNLAGVRDGKCPECGELAASRLRRLLKTLGFSDDTGACAGSRHPARA